MYLDVEDMQDQYNIQTNSDKTLEPLKKIGGLIKQAREEKAISVEDLAGSLRIGQEQLIALENGEEDLLPEKVFIKAMIRRVAERLHLDLNDVINEFDKKNSSVPERQERKQIDSQTQSVFKKIPTWAFLISLVGVTTSGFAITYLSNNQPNSTPKDLKPSKLLAPKRKAINSSYHIVAPGQTLSTISKFHEIPLKKLIQLNDLSNPDKLKIGTKLSLKEK